MIPSHTRELPGTVLAVMFIALLIGSSYWILLPFLPALVWATMVVIATWPVMTALERRMDNRRVLAVAIMLFAFFIMVVIPLLLAIITIVDNTDQIREWMHTVTTYERPAPPEWLREIPLVGQKLTAKWTIIASTNKDDIVAKVSPYMGQLVTWFVAQVGNVGMLLVHFFLTLILSAVLYLNGERAAEAVQRFSGRLAGERGIESARLAARSIRAVALGVVGTALCQSVVAGLGFAFAGIPQAVLLTAVAFFFSIVQIGTVPVMIPVVIWLFYTDATGWGVFMVVWTIIVGVMDNVMRPMLIKKGANLPLLLIFAGVIGGLIAFGVIGLFVGPVVLAVSYTLLHSWISEPVRT